MGALIPKSFIYTQIRIKKRIKVCFYWILFTVDNDKYYQFKDFPGVNIQTLWTLLYLMSKISAEGYWVLCRISSVMLYEPVFRILSTNFVVLLFFLYWFYFSLLNYELLLIDHMLLQCPIPVNWVWMWRFYQCFFSVKLSSSIQTNTWHLDYHI